MTFIVPFLLFCAGFGSGAWLAGRSSRGLLASALPLPSLVVGTAAAMSAYELATAGAGDGMTDLAVIALLTIGGMFALATFAGSLLGALWRRAGKVSQ